MDNVAFFERLAETAEMVVRHPDYPGKSQVLDHCRREVEDLTRAGRITADQGGVLHEILRGASPRTPDPAGVS